MMSIHENDIKRVLKNRQQDLETIHNRLMQMYGELYDTDSMIRSISLKSIDYDGIGGVGSEKTDLADLIIRHERATESRQVEIREEMRRLSLGEEMINRVWVCFQTLRGQEYDFIHELYVHAYPYKFVEKHSGVSHRTFEKIRRRAIKKIIELYQSRYSNIDIIRGARGQPKKKREEKETSGYHQLQLDLEALGKENKTHM